MNPRAPFDPTFPVKSPLFLCPVILIAAPAAAWGQAVSVAPPPPAAPGEVLMLTPFEVNSAKDTGYLASQTLSGTRLNTRIEDTGVAETIITPDFMRDLGITALDEVFKFVPNTTTDDPALGTAAGNSGLFSSVAYTSRGFTVANAQRDFLPTTASADIYNTDRISFTRGPNAILYGLGNPGGISNAVSQRANLHRPSLEVDVKADTNTGLRTSANANLPLIKGKLALRLARLDDDRGSHLKPDENLHRRTYAAVRLQPWTKTVVDVNYEDGDQRRRAFARGYTYSDGFSAWTALPAASRPRVTTAGAVLNNTTVAGLDQLIAANTIFLVDGATPAVAPMNWARMGKTRVPTPNLGGSIHGVSDREAFALPFPLETNLMGYSDGTQVDFRTLTASWQQNVLPQLDFELTYNRQFSDRFADYSKSAANDNLMVDPNAVLPSGAPNPNFGKYYTDAGGVPGVIFFQKNRLEVGRATVSYELDAKRALPRFGRWLGRHRLAGLIEQQRTGFSGVNNGTLRNLTPAKTSVPGLAATWAAAPGAASNVMQYRFYFDPAAGVSAMSSLWDKYPRFATSDNLAALQAALPAEANGVTPGFANSGLPVLRFTRVDTRIFATHNYWLNERVITLFGWRTDERTQYSRNLPLDPASLLYPDPAPYNARDGGTKTVQPAETFSRGVVLVVTPWLRLFYNASSSLVLQDPAASDLYSQPIDNAKGQGTETGLRVALFQGKVQASLSRWQTDLQGQAIATIRNQLGLFNFTNATNTLWNTAATLSGDNKYLQPPYRPAQNFTDYQDYVAEGYEFTLTANPTPQWRLTLNAGAQTNQQSNIGPVLKKYWAEYEPVWRSFPSRDLNGNGVIDATLPTTPQAQIERFLDRSGGTEAPTIGQLIDAYGAGVGRIAASSGVSTASIPKWSGNFVTNYRFATGWLKGVGLGGSLSYRGPRTIGFLLSPEGLYRPNLAIKGETTWDTGLWCSYARTFKLTASRAVRWRVQLNVRNVLDDRDLEPVTGLDDGAGRGEVIRWRVPEPRTFVLSNALEF